MERLVIDSYHLWRHYEQIGGRKHRNGDLVTGDYQTFFWIMFRWTSVSQVTWFKTSYNQFWVDFYVAFESSYKIA